ncbi:MAG: TlyA family RNA methyltransferase [Actinomycetota bacterium]|nr:MAG: TlyA family RNA methyltransferase [Actinomycetota bacterium]
MDLIKSRAAIRLDTALAERGYVDSREKASVLIREGKVLVNGAVAFKASRQVKPSDQINVAELPRYVSRGGVKLENALRRFAVPVAGLRVLDVGSSTGGFTDCLLQHGADTVYAVDVGTNQLHEKIKNDLRVTSFERTNIRTFRDPLETGFDLVVVDVSFTSVRTLAHHLMDLVRPAGKLLVLVKPQFEVGHRDASRGKGIIKDPKLWQNALHDVMDTFLQFGAAVNGLGVSGIRGTQGNVEFFFYFSKDSQDLGIDLGNLIEDEIARVSAESEA